jgi:hypothetical protein
VTITATVPPPPPGSTPVINTLAGAQSGAYYISFNGAEDLTVAGSYLDQGSDPKTGRIVVNGVEKGSVANPYIFNLNQDATIAYVKIPPAADVNVSPSTVGGAAVPLVIPSDTFGNSAPYTFYYVTTTPFASLAPTTSQNTGSPITVTGSNFKFGNVTNVSRVEFCDKGGAHTCKDGTNILADSATSLSVTAPPFPYGTFTEIKIYNLAGEVQTNSAVELNYYEPSRFASLDISGFSIPAGTRRDLQIIGLDQYGANLGDLGSNITSSETQGAGSITPGSGGSLARFTAGSTQGDYIVSITVNYQNIAVTKTFSVTVAAPEVLSSLIDPSSSSVPAILGNTVDFQAKVNLSTGQEENVSSQLNWTVTGGGTIAIDAQNNKAVLTLNGMQGTFTVQAVGTINGTPVSIQGMITATEPPPPPGSRPVISSLAGAQSGTYYLSSNGASDLEISGAYLDQGLDAKAGQIIVNNMLFGLSTSPYIFNVNADGTKAHIQIPTAANANINATDKGGSAVQLIIPSSTYGNSAPYIFYYVARTPFTSISPTTSQNTGSPITIAGQGFKFGNITNVSRVQICDKSGAKTCKDAASFSANSPTSLSVRAPAFPYGTLAEIKITNLVGEIETNSAAVLDYHEPNRLASLEIVNFSIPAGTSRDLQIIGLDQYGATFSGDLGSYITSTETRGAGSITPGSGGSPAHFAAGSSQATFAVSITINYQGVVLTKQFIVTVAPPEATSAFILPRTSEIVAGAGNTIKIKAAATFSAGPEENVSNKLTWTVSGNAGTIVKDYVNNEAIFTSNGKEGVFIVTATGAVTINGMPVTAQGTILAKAETDEYVSNVTVVPTGGSQPKQAQVSWTNMKTTAVQGYNVKLINVVSGVFAEKVVSAPSSNAFFNQVFAGGWYATVTPILSSGQAPETSSDKNQLAHFYLPFVPTDKVFTDLADQGNVVNKAVYFLANYQITSGFDDNTYRPKNRTSRGQMATFFHRLAGSPLIQGTPADFLDISTYGAKADIEWLSTTGITSGYICTAQGKPAKECKKSGDRVYKPNGYVTRAQMAIFMYAFAARPYMSDAEVKSYLAAFKDANKLNSASERIAVAWLIKAGVTSGYSDGTFRPSGNVTRAQMAIFLMGLASNLEVSE